MPENLQNSAVATGLERVNFHSNLKEGQGQGMFKLPNNCTHLLYTGKSVQFSSVAQSFLTLCNPMNRSMKGLTVNHQLPESTQTHVHHVGDAIQASHPLASPFPPAPVPSQHQGPFQ